VVAFVDLQVNVRGSTETLRFNLPGFGMQDDFVKDAI
jgi:hypothetical protein